MQTYEILVRNRAVVPNSKDMTLVRTSVGIDQVHVLFDNAEWLDFPVTITFAQGNELVTQSLVVSELSDAEWVAEATVTVPHEVIGMTGSIRVTLQGTDSEGNHIITAKGAPLSVEESGDVLIGDVPESAPTVDQWHQAYADAMALINQASSRISSLREELSSMVSEAVADIPQYVLPAASADTLGGVMVGSGLLMEDGVLSAIQQQHESGLTDAEASVLFNLQLLATKTFDTSFGSDGILRTATLKASGLPVATQSTPGIVRPDGTTVVTDVNGVLSSVMPIGASGVVGGVSPDGTTVVTDESGVLSAVIATPFEAGVVKPDGTTITVASDGTITASGGGAGGYVLPVATTSQLGGIRVDGETLVISEDGVVSVAYINADEMEF